ncbi:dual specificity protein phosphatase 13-like isoform X1 [Takifugu rubripes]|uniref:dual specificity protein phosphatase 13-like isoform X1 n=1 Tax=Takifugu rubripes TaxID=31033 RepID=UPI001145A50D|nr:dual specificity protein phosphatase 13-like isoform X1 [Takifugu rubripes]
MSTEPVKKTLQDRGPVWSVKELVTVLYGGKRFGNHVDEVWPNLFLGDMSVANDRYSLWKLGISHVVNAAHGSPHCQGCRDFYGSSVDYYGVPADDSPTFDLSPYFFPSADYIKKALDGAGGKRSTLAHTILKSSLVLLSVTLSSGAARVFVHCAVGVSRSAAVVLAYLMIHQRLGLLEAILKVKEHRWIFPNRGFLKQLRALDVELQEATLRAPPQQR